MVSIKKPNHLAISGLNGFVVLEMMLKLFFSDLLCLCFQLRKKLWVGVISVSMREMHSRFVLKKERANQPQVADIPKGLGIIFTFNLESYTYFDK